jgi:hypothetical protein
MKKEHFIIQAIQALVPKRTNWILEENGNLIWGDNGSNFTPPTQSEIEEKALELEEEYNSKTYSRKRVEEYPAIGDQLDALFHAGVFPEDMAAQIQAIKDKYPKS